MPCRFAVGSEAHHWARWAAERIPGCERGWGDCVVMLSWRGDDYCGAVVFHDWQPQNGTMCMSAAGYGAWMSREAIRRAHNYIFNVACCQLAIMQVSENNRAMNRIAERLGYSATYIPRLRGPDEGENIWTLPIETWRASKFAEVKHGKTRRARAA